jgi:hypothetical protein
VPPVLFERDSNLARSCAAVNAEPKKPSGDMSLLRGVSARNPQAPLPARADAALLQFTAFVPQDDGALPLVVGALRPRARIIAAGLEWAPAPLRLLDLPVAPAALHSATVLDGPDGATPPGAGWRGRSAIGKSNRGSAAPPASRAGRSRATPATLNTAA